MSTIINSIALCNFYNYYGDYDDNMYEFNESLNVIVADNGGGKSRLFSAFSWILLDKVLHSETKQYVPVRNAMVEMISDKAKNETFVNDEVKSGVTIRFSDTDFEYEVEKCLYGKRLSNGSPTNADTWDCYLKDTHVSKKDKMLLDFRNVYDSDEKERIIKKIIRPEFLQYALLQGEEVDQVIDFSDKESLKNAIDTLSNVTKIEQLIPLTKYLAKKGDEDLTSAKKQTARNVKDFNERVSERNDIKRNLERAERDLIKYNEELVKAKAERDRLIGLISTAEDRQEIRTKRNIIKEQIDELNTQHADFLNNLNDNFFDVRRSWLLYNTSQNAKKYIQLRDSYLDRVKGKRIIQEIRDGEESFLTRLPEGSPDSYSLRKMIEKEECFVCGRPAKKESKEWLHIKSVLNAHTNPKSFKLQTKNNFSKLLNELLTSSQSYFNQIQGIEEDINSSRKLDRDFRDKKKEKQSIWEQLRLDLLGLGESKEDKDRNVINQFGGAERRIQKYEGEVRQTEVTIESLKRTLASKNIEIDKLSSSEPDVKYQKRQEIMNDIYEISKRTKQRIFDDIVKKLEEKSNYYFKKLTKENAVDGGIIKIVRNADETFALEIWDEEGNKIYGLSEGFQRMKKLAVIMAIIASSERGRMDYPLIADAPLSAFGKGFIKSFFEEVPEVFNQSIVMVKDLFDGSTSDYLNEIGRDVLNKIKLSPGSYHLNLINEKQPQILRETRIIRY